METTLVHASIPSAKAVLRLEMQALRAGLAAAAPRAGELAAARLPVALLGRFAVVAGYHPFRSEIDPAPALRRLAEAGAAIALPVTPPRGSDAPLSFHRWSPEAGLSRGGFGVLEPSPRAETLEPDLVVTPLLAFDRAGARLGYGQGHFDRTLEALRARRPVFVLGLAFAGQEVARVPAEPHDQHLDAILTETGYIAVRKDT
ncbi:MAG: 5-formyltetrahydrofolate cyclo-ligase [Caulobacteraceae bacterium]|nr:5-formyltetrahydrofolate cyclo-ligase [Caulobacteraceae bacterium]